jgi:DeoR family fructose operon transcriptional repressor
MKNEERKRFIIEELEIKNAVNVQDVTKRFHVSQMTVRRDLAELEAAGCLIRKYGGAVKSEMLSGLFSFSRRAEQKSEQKEAVCSLAARFLADDETIFIDCGTTLFRMWQHIVKRRNIRVITNSLPVVSELINYSNVRVNMIGGDVDNSRKAVYGLFAEKIIAEYHADKAFVGSDGISLSNGLSSFDEKEARITQKMIENSDSVFLLCDSSKIEKDSFFRLAPVSVVHHLITDGGIDPQSLLRYREAGVDILIST